MRQEEACLQRVCCGESERGEDHERREKNRRPLDAIFEVVLVVRVPAFRADCEGADCADDAEMLLKASDADVVAKAWIAKRERSFNGATAKAVIFFALQIARNDTEVRAGAEEKRCEDRRTHNDIGDGQAPAAGFARNAADVEAKADEAVSKRKKAGVAKEGICKGPAEEAADASDGEGAGENDRRIHDRIGVACLCSARRRLPCR